jgi:hypothetical protein
MAGAITRVYVKSGTGALEASQVVKASACNVEEVICTNTGAAAVYCQLFNSATVPADSTTPVIVFAVPAGSTASWDSQQGVTFDTGLSVCVSSTAHTKTIAAAEAVFNSLVQGRE